jgi:hydrogenase nickel incorporation protein HypB
MTHYAPFDVDRLLASLDRTIARLQPSDPLSGRRGPLRTHRFGHENDTGAGGAGDAAEADVLAAVRETAGDVHKRLGHDHDVFAVELLGATGAGKTALLESLLAADGPAPFAGEHVGVITGDVAGTDDADRLRNRGVPVVNVTTGRDCHLDPERVDSALDEFDLARLDVLFVENVGNMVCPADFPLGTDVRAVVVSPTEGDDVVRKHPMLFQICDVAVVNKVDVAAAVGADVARMTDDIDHVAPGTPVLRTSAETGAGVDDLAAWLVDRRRGRVHAHHD